MHGYWGVRSLIIRERTPQFIAFSENWAIHHVAVLMVTTFQRAAQQGSGAELLKLRFLWLVGAATYLIIGGGCANPQSPQLKR